MMFEEGCLVECLANVHDHTWYTGRRASAPTVGPNKGEITTVAGISPTGGLLFVEYPLDKNMGFAPEYFRKIQPPMNVSEVVEQCLVEVV